MACLLVFAMLMLSITGKATCNWCVCNPSLPDATLQKTLDYACGAGADCNPIHEKGICFMPNTVKSHCNYAVNSFFQKKNQQQGSCDFSGTAILTQSDPSFTGCSFPASLSAAAGTGGNSPATTTPATSGNNNGAPKTTTSPYTTPTNGIMGGINGVGPSGLGTSPDYSHGERKVGGSFVVMLTGILASALMAVWG